MIVPADLSVPLETHDPPARGGILFWLLAGAIAFIPVQIDTGAEFRFAPSDLFLGLAALFGIGVWRINRAAWSPFHLVLLSLIPIAVIVKNIFVGNVVQGDLLNKLGGILVLFSFYLCLTTLADNWTELCRLLRVFAVSVVVLNTASCMAFQWCKQTGSENPVLLFLLSGQVDRLAGMLVDANAYGGLLCAAYAIVLLCNDPERRLLPNWLRVISLISLTMGLWLTSSRSAWIGFALLTMVGIVQNPRLLIVVPLIIVLGVAGAALTMSEQDFEGMVEISSRQNTIEDRVEIGRNAWIMFMEYPIFGGGIGAYYEAHGIIVHNSTLWFLAEFGLVGGAIFLSYIGWFCLRGIAAYRYGSSADRAYVAGLIGAHLAMIGFSLGIEAFYQRYWWFVMAMLASASALVLRAPAAEQEAEPPMVDQALPASTQAPGVVS